MLKAKHRIVAPEVIKEGGHPRFLPDTTDVNIRAESNKKIYPGTQGKLCELRLGKDSLQHKKHKP